MFKEMPPEQESEKMTEEQVVVLMESSNSEEEWNQNCDMVKKSFNEDYPEFWYKEIIISGVADEVRSNWENKKSVSEEMSPEQELEETTEEPEKITEEQVEQSEKHGFNEVYHLDGDDKYEGNADFVILVWHDNRILSADQYRNAKYKEEKVDVVVCENPNKQKEQLGDKAIIL